MEKDKVNIRLLFQKYVEDTISPAELDMLVSLSDLYTFKSLSEEFILFYFYDEEQIISENIKLKSHHVVGKAWENIDKHIDEQTINKRPIKRIATKYLKYAAIFIASSLLLWGSANYFPLNSSKKSVIAKKDEIFTNRNFPTLTLSNGKSIQLSHDHVGLVINEKGIVYEDGTSVIGSDNLESATITTPRGTTYQITLPDGSKVWLNAASELHYPLKFSNTERHVLLRGEAYFEIKELYTSASAKSGTQRIPFIVSSARQKIEVLGTKFNVKAYPDEQITKTALIEGKIRLSTVKNGRVENKILKPGDQASVDEKQLSIISVSNVDLQIAWKEGVILLDEKTIEQVLKQLERSYDVVFIFKNNIKLPRKTLSGELQSNLPLSIILDALAKQSELKFEIKGRRIMVDN